MEAKSDQSSSLVETFDFLKNTSNRKKATNKTFREDVEIPIGASSIEYNRALHHNSID
jgi:hypothetical protein